MEKDTRHVGLASRRMVVLMLGMFSVVMVVGVAGAAGVGKELSFPTTDGGRVLAPPGACKVTDGGTARIGCAPVAITCNKGLKAANTNVSGYVIQNPANSDAGIRIGPAAVRGYPNPNGIKLEPGQAIGWTVAQGVPYVVTDSTNDAGMRVDVVCELEGF